MQWDDDGQVAFGMMELTVAAARPDRDESGSLKRPDDLEPRDNGEFGHAGTRTSTDISFGDTGTSGTGVSSK